MCTFVEQETYVEIGDRACEWTSCSPGARSRRLV
jgi:hypothetical protein